MTLDVKRLAHCQSVGMRMRDIVQQHQDKFTCSPEEAYVLGTLHDFAYPFVKNQEDHAYFGAFTLRDSGYKYWREVYYHSAWQSEYESPLLYALYYADMTVGPAGEDMTIQERLDDIAVRYGKDSTQYNESKVLASVLLGRLNEIHI